MQLNKLLLILIIGIFLFNFVSAGTLDFNKKYFDDSIGSYGKIEIKDWFGINKIQELELKRNTELCTNDCEADLEIIMDNKGILIEDIRFENIKGNGIKDYEILVNGKKYKLGDEVNKGTYSININGELNPFAVIDWQIKSNGIWLDEWDVWNSTYNTDLVHYYYFNDGTDEFGTINFSTNEGAITYHPSSLSGNAGNFSDNKNINLSYSNSDNRFNFTADTTWNIWLNKSVAGSGTIATKKLGGTGWFILDNSADLYIEGITSGGSPTVPSLDNQLGQWQMLTITSNSSHGCIYKNGTLVQCLASSITYGNVNVTLGSGSVISEGDWKGEMDEFGIWDRILNPTEITDLYNSGSGIFYTLTFPPTLTLNKPSNGYSNITQDVLFNCSANASVGRTIDNITLIIDGFNNYTESKSLQDETLEKTITFADGNHNWSCGACDNTSICANATATNTIVISEIADLNEYSYTTPIQEGETSTFIANFSVRTLTSSLINYNNTNYTNSVVSYGGNKYGFSKTIQSPFVSINKNISFYYLINGINTTIKNQSVLNVGVDNCSVFTYPIVNYNLKDEETEVLINNSNSTVEVEIDIYSSVGDLMSQYTEALVGNSTFSVCSNINLTNSSTRLYEQSRYYSDNYVAELHNIQNLSMNTTFPINITLLDLLSADATEFLVIYKSNQFLPVEDAIIDIQRKYISKGVYKTVEIPKTDSNGQTKANFDLNGVIYRATVSKEGTLLGEFENLAVTCQNELSGECELTLNELQSVSEIGRIDTENDFTYSLSKDNRTIYLTFSSPTGNAKTVYMAVNSSSILGNLSECNTTVYSSSGVIECEVSNTLGDSFTTIEIYVDGEYISGASTTILVDRETYFGLDHIVLTFFLVLSLGLMMISNPIAILIGVCIGLFSSSLMLFTTNGFYGGSAVIIYIILTIILIIVKISQRE